jgi:hypothetical protein
MHSAGNVKCSVISVSSQLALARESAADDMRRQVRASDLEVIEVE